MREAPAVWRVGYACGGAALVGTAAVGALLRHKVRGSAVSKPWASKLLQASCVAREPNVCNWWWWWWWSLLAHVKAHLHEELQQIASPHSLTWHWLGSCLSVMMP